MAFYSRYGIDGRTVIKVPVDVRVKVLSFFRSLTY